MLLSIPKSDIFAADFGQPNTPNTSLQAECVTDRQLFPDHTAYCRGICALQRARHAVGVAHRRAAQLCMRRRGSAGRQARQCAHLWHGPAHPQVSRVRHISLAVPESLMVTDCLVHLPAKLKSRARLLLGTKLDCMRKDWKYTAIEKEKSFL